MTSWFEQKIAPMLAVRGKPFSNDKYIYEIKWDGMSALMISENGAVSLGLKLWLCPPPKIQDLLGVVKFFK